MSDLADFNPETIDELLDRIFADVAEIGRDWLEENRETLGGYFRALAEATLQTRASLASGRISEDYADQVMHMQQAAFRQTIKYTEYMTLVLSQRIVNAVFRIVAFAIRNRTGLDIFPELTAGD